GGGGCTALLGGGGGGGGAPPAPAANNFSGPRQCHRSCLRSTRSHRSWAATWPALKRSCRGQDTVPKIVRWRSSSTMQHRMVSWCIALLAITRLHAAIM